MRTLEVLLLGPTQTKSVLWILCCSKAKFSFKQKTMFAKRTALYLSLLLQLAKKTGCTTSAEAAEAAETAEAAEAAEASEAIWRSLK